MSLTIDQKIALTGIAIEYISKPDAPRSVDYLNKYLPNVYLALEAFVTSEEPVKPTENPKSSVSKLSM